MTAAAAQLIGGLGQDISASGEDAASAAEEIINAEKPIEKGVEVILENSESARKLLRGLLQKIPAQE